MSVTDQELADLEKQIAATKEQAPPAETPSEPVPVETPPLDAASGSNEPGAAPEPPQNEGFDASEWVKKKGWKTAEDAAKSLHSLEKAFHEKNEELRRMKEQNPQGWPQGPQGYAPPPPPQGWSPPAPSYAPPVNPWAPPPPAYAPPPAYGYRPPKPSEETIAASYGMTVEDFRRVLAVSQDISDVQARQLAAQFQSWKEEVSRNNDKSADMTAVLSDPAFHNPDVQYEMHEIFSKNQNILNERKPYSAALEKALTNIGRRNLTGASRTSGMALPTDPPKTAGSGHASGSLPGKRGIGAMPTMKEAQGMNPEQLEKLLKGMGAVKTYEDL